MQYLVGQMLTCLLVAASLGVVIGWIWWGMRLRQSHERAADLEQKVSKLSGYPARLTDLEATHSAFVASKNEEDAKCKSRIAELEKSLAAKTAEWEGLQTEIAGKTSELATLEERHKSVLQSSDARVAELEGAVKSKDAEIAEHVQAHADKDARLVTLTSRVAELEPAAKRVLLLEAQIEQHVDAHRETDEHLEQLVGQVKQHEAAQAEKDQKIAELLPLAALVPSLKADLAAKVAQTAALKTLVDRHIAELASQDTHIADLSAQVDRHVAAHAEKDARISELAPLAALVTSLKSELGTKDSQAATLKAQVDRHIVELAEQDTHIAELAAQMDQHVAAHAEKDTHIGALLSRVEELQPLVVTHVDLQNRLETAEYEGNLATRKLRMAESAVAAHQSEAAKLHDQLVMHRAELESVKQEQQAQPVALKAMAAAAGAGASAAAMHFYDVNEGSTSVAAPAAETPDHVREFEKRIGELRSVESAKDDEIAKLRKKLADVEEAPDPDTKRQILFAAKNAELTHLRGVLNSLLQPVRQEEIALRAFSYAKDRGFRGGSPTEDWLRAERDTHYTRLAYAWESTRSGTMY